MNEFVVDNCKNHFIRTEFTDKKDCGISYTTTATNSYNTNSKPDNDINNDVVESFHKISEEDPIVAQAIGDVIKYIASTYNDKYSKPGDAFNTKTILYNKKHGSSANVFNVLKYMQRYLSEGFEKSHQTIDVKKAIHYLIFELVNRNINDESEKKEKSDKKSFGFAEHISKEQIRELWNNYFEKIDKNGKVNN